MPDTLSQDGVSLRSLDSRAAAFCDRRRGIVPWLRAGCSPVSWCDASVSQRGVSAGSRTAGSR
eukprot:scaffold25443_cov75-Phaeocystis_antarctica.AAC.2